MDRDTGKILEERYEPRITYARALELAAAEFKRLGATTVPRREHLITDRAGEMVLIIHEGYSGAFRRASGETVTGEGNITYIVVVDARSGAILPSHLPDFTICGEQWVLVGGGWPVREGERRA